MVVPAVNELQTEGKGSWHYRDAAEKRCSSRADVVTLIMLARRIWEACRFLHWHCVLVLIAYLDGTRTRQWRERRREEMRI